MATGGRLLAGSGQACYDLDCDRLHLSSQIVCADASNAAPSEVPPTPGPGGPGGAADALSWQSAKDTATRSVTLIRVPYKEYCSRLSRMCVRRAAKAMGSAGIGRLPDSMVFSSPPPCRKHPASSTRAKLLYRSRLVDFSAALQPVPAAEVCSGQGRANLPDPPCGGVPEPTPQLGPAPHTLRPAQEVHRWPRTARRWR